MNDANNLQTLGTQPLDHDAGDFHHHGGAGIQLYGGRSARRGRSVCYRALVFCVLGKSNVLAASRAPVRVGKVSDRRRALAERKGLVRRPYALRKHWCLRPAILTIDRQELVLSRQSIGKDLPTAASGPRKGSVGPTGCCRKDLRPAERDV